MNCDIQKAATEDRDGRWGKGKARWGRGVGGEETEKEEEKEGWGVGSNKTAEGKGRPAAAQRDTLQPPIARQAGGDYGGGGGGCRRSGGERMQEGSGEFGEGEGGKGGTYCACTHCIQWLYAATF